MTIAAILMAIMFIVHQTKPIFQHGREFDKRKKYMKFGRNRVINELVRVSSSANRQVVAMLATILVILQNHYLNLDGS